jgi:hypothetical protein
MSGKSRRSATATFVHLKTTARNPTYPSNSGCHHATVSLRQRVGTQQSRFQYRTQFLGVIESAVTRGTTGIPRSLFSPFASLLLAPKTRVHLYMKLTSLTLTLVACLFASGVRSCLLPERYQLGLTSYPHDNLYTPSPIMTTAAPISDTENRVFRQAFRGSCLVYSLVRDFLTARTHRPSILAKLY